MPHLTFRPILIDCINIPKFKNNDTSRRKCTSGASRGWEWASERSVFQWKAFLDNILVSLFETCAFEFGLGRRALQVANTAGMNQTRKSDLGLSRSLPAKL